MFYSKWRIDSCSYAEVVQDVLMERMTLPKLFPRLGIDKSLNILLNDVYTSHLEVKCNNDVKTSSWCVVHPRVVLLLDKDNHLELLVRFGPGTCIESVLQHIAVLLESVVEATSLDQDGTQHTRVYAIRDRTYPPVCFTSQLPTTTDMGRLQKSLGCNMHYTVWIVGISRRGTALVENEHAHVSRGLCVGTNYAVDGLTTAKLMMLYALTHPGQISLEVRRIVEFK